MYKVIKFFTDLQDSNYAYKVGDVFPREGMTVSDKRLKELSGSKNKQGVPLIEKVKDSLNLADTPVQQSEAVGRELPPKDVVEDAGEHKKSKTNKK